MASKVLLLDSAYVPKSVISVERAMSLLITDRAKLVEDDSSKKIRTVSKEFPFPIIIKLNHYIKSKFKKVSPSKKNIYIRDNFECVYCGAKHDLTIDHVIPISKGGENTWDNMVSACRRCNSKKGDRTPDEANMKFIKDILSPDIFLIIRGYRNESWNKFCLF